MLPPACLALPATLSGHTRAQSAAAPSAWPLLPLIVRRTGIETYEIIDGEKRFLRHYTQRAGECPCGVIEQQIDQVQAGFLRIRLNQGRPRTIAESLAWIRFIRANVAAETFRDKAAVLGFADTDVSSLWPLLDAPAALCRLVDDGTIPLRLAGRFAHWTDGDLASFTALFAGLQPSFQILREMAEWLPEIAAARSCTVTRLLEDAAIRSAMSPGRLSDPEKIQALRDAVFAMRFPQLNGLLRRWEESAQAANPDQRRVTFGHAPCFEKNRLDIRISAASGAEACRLIGLLARVPEKTWQTLVYPG